MTEENKVMDEAAEKAENNQETKESQQEAPKMNEEDKAAQNEANEAGKANGDGEKGGDKEEDSPGNELEELRQKVAELEAKLSEKDDRYLRLQADFENFRRRSRLDYEAAQKYRVQSLATDLLQVLDNFERALNIETENAEVKSVLEGMEMIYRSLLEALKKEGVEPIEAVGKEFDPRYHQAVMQVKEEGYGSNIVVGELQKGYLLKDRVIRPSMVKVNE
mgnify:CR=1 FL=1